MKKSYSPAFKAQMVRELLKKEKSVSQLAAEHSLHPNQLYRWRDLALAGLPTLFEQDGAIEQAAKDAAHEQHLQEFILPPCHVRPLIRQRRIRHGRYER